MKHGYIFQIRLPLQRSVIFVDWHGVLSNHLFWHSILTNTSHPLYTRLKTATERFFTGDPRRVRAWMRGDLTSADIINSLNLTLPGRYRPQYLQRVLFKDCRKMRPSPELLEVLQPYRSDSWLVLATDNMDCFADNVTSISGLPYAFDFVLCSAELGVVKGDGVNEFFGPWLRAHQLHFNQAILIDDSESTCKAFKEAGGVAILHRTIHDTKHQLSEAQGTLSRAEAR